MNYFYLYGAGIYCRAILKSSNIMPIAIIDKGLYGTNLSGIPVFHPESQELNKSIKIYNTILGYPGVKKNLNDIGFFDVVETHDTFDVFPQSLNDLNTDGEFWRVKDISRKVNEEKLFKFFNILEDRKSKETLNSLVEYRKNPSSISYPWPEKYEMYFPGNITRLYSIYDNLSILDCGAYNGDTAIQFYKRYKDKIIDYTAVEPSEKNAADLEVTLSNLIDIKNRIIINKGIDGVPSEAVVFDAGSASVISNESTNGNKVQITTILDIIDQTKIKYNVIKMDIEGYDRSAIKSAIPYIDKHTPTLCLSIYHNPEDLWAIALDIYNVVGERYCFYLRNEGHWGYETILYCIPRER